MQFTVIMIGKTSTSFVMDGVDEFSERFRHYHPLNFITIPDLKDRKNLNPELIKEKEAEIIRQNLPKNAIKIVLDERGKEYRSVDFAAFLQKMFNKGSKEIVFIIGGAYGISDTLSGSVDHRISLSQMTFTHQFIRLMLVEQLYRAMTILKNEPYHNE